MNLLINLAAQGNWCEYESIFVYMYTKHFSNFGEAISFPESTGIPFNVVASAATLEEAIVKIDDFYNDELVLNLTDANYSWEVFEGGYIHMENGDLKCLSLYECTKAGVTPNSIIGTSDDCEEILITKTEDGFVVRYFVVTPQTPPILEGWEFRCVLAPRRLTYEFKGIAAKEGQALMLPAFLTEEQASSLRSYEAPPIRSKEVPGNRETLTLANFPAKEVLVASLQKKFNLTIDPKEVISLEPIFCEETQKMVGYRHPKKVTGTTLLLETHSLMWGTGGTFYDVDSEVLETGYIQTLKSSKVVYAVNPTAETIAESKKIIEEEGRLRHDTYSKTEYVWES